MEKQNLWPSNRDFGKNSAYIENLMKKISFDDFELIVYNVPYPRSYNVKTLPDLIREEGKEYMVSAEIEIKNNVETFCFIVAEINNGCINVIQDGRVSNCFTTYSDSPVKGYVERLGSFYDTAVWVSRSQISKYNL